VQISLDGGQHWTNVTKNIPNLPEWGTVSNIEASRHDAGTAYLTVDFHQMNNHDPFVYKTTDYGKTWTSITNGIPHSILSYGHCIREDPVRGGLLYLGTEDGLYVSFDDGGNWQPLQSGLPHAPVYWIAVQERFHDLALATYGRGFWILDDLTALEQLTPETLKSNAYLFAPRDSYRFRGVENPEAFFYDPTAGRNPPYGAAINFYLKSKLEETEHLRLTISNASGKTVHEIECHAPKEGAGEGEGCEAKPGINRIWWNLQFERGTQIKLRTSPLYAPDVKLGAEGWRAAPDASRLFLLAPPGTYTVTLTLGNAKSSQKLTVLKDPHSTGTEGDIQAQTQFLTSLLDEMDAIVQSVNQIESVRVQVAALEKELGMDDAGKVIRNAADELTDKLTILEGKVLQLRETGRGQEDHRWPRMLANKIAYLARQAASSDFPPTTQQVAVGDELKKQGEQFQREYQQIMAKEVASFNAMLQEKKIPNIIVKGQPESSISK